MPGGIAAKRQRTTFTAQTRGDLSQIMYPTMLLVLYAQASLTLLMGTPMASKTGISRALHSGS
jgi:hypothetical protein